MLSNTKSSNKSYVKLYKELGFTLIELLVTIAIIAILAAVVYPSYNNYLVQSRRSSAQSTLQGIITTAQQFSAQNNGNYPPSTTTITALYNTFNLTPPTSPYYTFGLAACAGGVANCIQATATAITNTTQSNDTGCTQLTLDSNGNRTPTPTTAVNCWPK